MDSSWAQVDDVRLCNDLGGRRDVICPSHHHRPRDVRESLTRRRDSCRCGRPYTIHLTGANEVTAAGVPNQGDPDGSGTARLWINPGQEEVCWAIEVSGVEPIMAGHIHAAPSTTNGPIVVPFDPYSGGCTHVDRALARALINNPDDYYVNVHNMPYPGGALRGQLSR